MEVVKKTEPGSFQCCLVRGPEAVITNWNMGGSVPISGNTFFYCESDWAVAQVDQGGCGVFILGDIKKTSWYVPQQPALGGPAWEGGLENVTSRSPFQSQPFHGSVILQQIFYFLVQKIEEGGKKGKTKQNVTLHKKKEKSQDKKLS